MSWLQQLYDIYELASQRDLSNDTILRPYYHMFKNSEIIITLNEFGDFKMAEFVVDNNGKPNAEQRLIACTNDSANRTSTTIAPHALSDEFQYIAGDYERFTGEDKEKAFNKYSDSLKQWYEYDPSQIMVSAVYAYITKKTVLTDLFNHEHSQVKKIFDNNGKLIKPKQTVLWRIQPTTGDSLVESWNINNRTLIESWQSFYEATLDLPVDLCYGSGNIDYIITKHSKGFLSGSSGSKLISCNDDSDFTFRGKFTNTPKDSVYQASNVGGLFSDKAHAALDWLLKRQGYNNDGLGIVAWAGTQPVIQPTEDMSNLFNFDINTLETTKEVTQSKNLANNLGLDAGLTSRNYLLGYYKKLSESEVKQLSIIAVTASTTGRAAVTYYKQTNPQEYYERLTDWHTQFAWKTPFITKGVVQYKPLSPSLYRLSQTLYGRKGTETAKKQRRLLYQRLLPSIVDRQPFPADIMNACYQIAVNPYHDRADANNISFNEKLKLWQQDINVFCAIYRGYSIRNQKRSISVELDETNTNRSYLFGRLLAVANRIEELALSLAQEPRRPTNAFKYMQRFSQRPSHVWTSLRTEYLPPYQKRLISKIPPLESAYKRLIEDIEATLQSSEDFTSNKRLDPDFLLGYDLQSKWLREHKLKQGKWIRKEQVDESGEIIPEDLEATGLSES